MGDGKLELLRLDNERQKPLCKGNDLKDDGVLLELWLKQVIKALQEDGEFLSDGLVAAEQEYEKSLMHPTLLNTCWRLCWKHVEVNTAFHQAQCFLEQ